MRSSPSWRACDDDAARTAPQPRFNAVPPTRAGQRRARAHVARSARASRLARGDQPQVDRQALHRHRVRLLRRRRRARGGDAAAAGAPGQQPDRPRPLQPALHDARHDDDVPVRRAGDAGDVGLPRAAHDRHAQRRLPAHERLRLLGLPVRRPDALRCVPAQHRPRRRLVRLRAALRARLLARQARRLLGPADHLHRALGPARGGDPGHHRLQAARAGHDAQPHSALRLGHARHRVHGDVRDAGGDAGEHRADHRPPRRHPFLQPGRRRRRAALAAPVLVLRPPRGLHHLHPRARLHVVDHPDLRTPADLRLHGDGAVADRDRVPGLRPVGAPHVRDQPAGARQELLHGGQHDDRDPVGGADLLLDRDAVDRPARLQARRCCSSSPSSSSSSSAA